MALARTVLTGIAADRGGAAYADADCGGADRGVSGATVL